MVETHSKTAFLRSNSENCEHAGEEHVHPKKKSSLVKTRTSPEQSGNNGFVQLTSDYTEATTSTKSKVMTMFTNTIKRLGNALSNVLNSAKEKIISKVSNDNANLDHTNLAYIEYKTLGEYWNRTPKTDYTYSRLSKDRRELAPGIIAMPNMARFSLATHLKRIGFMVQQNRDQEGFMRRLYLYISSVLGLETWLLEPGNMANKAKISILILLLILLSLLIGLILGIIIGCKIC